MRFFFDNCLSPRLAQAIHCLVEPEHKVEPLRDRFHPTTPDIEWITALAEDGDWIILSGDLRIRKRPGEREVWRQSGLTTFFMAKGFMEQPQWEQVKWLINKWPLIADMASKVGPGATFMVPKRGAKLIQV